MRITWNGVGILHIFLPSVFAEDKEWRWCCISRAMLKPFRSATLYSSFEALAIFVESILRQLF